MCPKLLVSESAKAPLKSSKHKEDNGNIKVWTHDDEKMGWPTKNGDCLMKRVEAERGALLCAAHFIVDYENLTPSIRGEYSADYCATVDGEPVMMSCTCLRSGTRGGIKAFRFRIEEFCGGEEIEVEGEYGEACNAATRFINEYLRLLKH